MSAQLTALTASGQMKNKPPNIPSASCPGRLVTQTPKTLDAIIHTPTDNEVLATHSASTFFLLTRDARIRANVMTGMNNTEDMNATVAPPA